MFKPHCSINATIANALVKLERLRYEIEGLSLTPKILYSLRESARLSAIHHSTQIESNRLTKAQIIQTIKEKKILPARTRDQHEVLGYYVALDEIERLVTSKNKVTEKHVKKIHALIMNNGTTKVKPTPYRTQQNVIRKSATKRIVYLPPEPQDVPLLMHDLVQWIDENPDNLPYPLVAAIAHYQFATIHPYIDGNGRTARLLATFILHLCDYDLKGIYSLDEYYAKDLAAYYQALSIGPSHNYYMGRAESDITPWIEYFVLGMVESFEAVKRHARVASSQQTKDSAAASRKLDAKQRTALTLFHNHEVITSSDIATLLSISPRAARNICQQWVENGFLVIKNPAKRNRTYALSPLYAQLIGV